MILIVGLGNPGRKFKKTRHNAGFRVIDELRSSLALRSARAIDEFRKENNFPKFKSSKKFESLTSKGSLNPVRDHKTKEKTQREQISNGVNRKKVILAKPQTFMNNSGQAVKKIINNYQLTIDNLFVIHDDIDLPLGKIRISKARGAAGHKGVQSIINELGTKDFVRFRIGILPKWGKPKKVEKFVLKKFTKKEEKIVKESIKKTVKIIEITLRQGIEKATQKFNI